MNNITNKRHLIPYGEKKRGSSKLHPHNECEVCSEKTFSKKAARREAKKYIDKQLEDWHHCIEHDGLFDEIVK